MPIRDGDELDAQLHALFAAMRTRQIVVTEGFHEQLSANLDMVEPLNTGPQPATATSALVELSNILVRLGHEDLVELLTGATHEEPPDEMTPLAPAAGGDRDEQQ